MADPLGRQLPSAPGGGSSQLCKGPRGPHSGRSANRHRLIAPEPYRLGVLVQPLGAQHK